MQRSDLGEGIVRARDAHHDGFFEWAFDGSDLWHKATINSKWTKVKKISFTPARVLLIAELVEKWTLNQLPRRAMQ